MRVLLDTNIIIHREAGKVINQDIGVLFNWLDRLHYAKCVHGLTATELERHLDPSTVNSMRIKLGNYNILQTEAAMDAAVKAVSDKVDVTPNDFDDTRLLNEVFCNRVDCLITEDKKIHAKAEMLGIAERVFRIESFLEKVISENPEFIDYKVLSVRKELFGNINLHDSFFDTFREDYVAFDKWYNGKAGSDEQAFVCHQSDSLTAFLYIKVEDKNESYADIHPPFTSKKRLKIGTFKVASNGIRLGERFLKILFDHARLYKVEEIYVTIFEKRPEAKGLVSLLESFGFKLHGTKTTRSGIEKVYTRDVSRTPVPDRENPRRTFPSVSREARVFIIPIKPEYHTELFPDSILRTESPDDFIENEPHRNSISKSYISHSSNRNLNSGDIIVFYRSGGMYKGVATTIGIVEGVKTNIASLEELVAICRRRSVLSEKELGEYWERLPHNRPFVIDFLYAYSFKKRMNLKAMIEHGILSGMESVKTITEMRMDKFKQLCSESGI